MPLLLALPLLALGIAGTYWSFKTLPTSANTGDRLIIGVLCVLFTLLVLWHLGASLLTALGVL